MRQPIIDGWCTKPFLAGLVGALVLLGTGTRSSAIGLASAWAQEAPTSASVASSPRRVEDLVERIKSLEIEIEYLERRMRTLESRGQAPLESDKHSPGSNAEPGDSCKDPYIDVGRGVRRVKPGCESLGNLCDAPEVVDARGIRVVLPACRPSVEAKSGGCTSPYSVDPMGLKRFKEECL